MPQVNFRTSSQRLAFIDRAAAVRGVSRTEFVLRSSEAAAIDVLSERPSSLSATRLGTTSSRLSTRRWIRTPP